MKTIKTILKFLLLWGTAISIAVFVCGIESMVYYSNYTLLTFWAFMNLLLCVLCKKCLTILNVYRFSGMRVLNKIIE